MSIYGDTFRHPGAVVMAGPHGYRASAHSYVIGPLRATADEARADLAALMSEFWLHAGRPSFGSWCAHAWRME